MENTSEETVIINLLKQTVESEGCKLTDIDLENNILKVDGPDEVVAERFLTDKKSKEDLMVDLSGATGKNFKPEQLSYLR